MYGHVDCISLTELTNREAIVGGAFHEAINRFKEDRSIE